MTPNLLQVERPLPSRKFPSKLPLVYKHTINLVGRSRLFTGKERNTPPIYNKLPSVCRQQQQQLPLVYKQQIWWCRIRLFTGKEHNSHHQTIQLPPVFRHIPSFTSRCGLEPNSIFGKSEKGDLPPGSVVAQCVPRENKAIFINIKTQNSSLGSDPFEGVNGTHRKTVKGRLYILKIRILV